MTLPPERIGDNSGHRYEIRALDADGEEFVVGWSNNWNAFIRGIDAHPSWHSRRVFDRHNDNREVTDAKPDPEEPSGGGSGAAESS